MKKIVSFILTTVLMLSLLACFAACDDRKDEQHLPAALSFDGPFAESFVLGARRNFPGIKSNAQSIYALVLEACTNYGEVSYAVVEGNPGQTRADVIEESDKILSSAKKKQMAKARATSILNHFAALSAVSPEVDTLQTIRLSASSLHSSILHNKIMAVFDNGLCTTGLLSQIKNNVLATDPKIVVDKLAALHALPDLNGVIVYWVGLGCVSGAQGRIPDSYLYHLRKLWKAIIERSGGTVYFDSTPVTGQEREGLPHVSVVDFPQDELNLGPVNMETTAVMKLKEDTVKFNGKIWCGSY